MKIRNKILIAGCMLLMTSCGDAQLDLPIYTDQTEDNFYRNTDELSSALTGVYYQQRAIWSDLSLYCRTIMEIPTDNAVKGGYDDSDHTEILQLEQFNIEATTRQPMRCIRYVSE